MVALQLYDQAVCSFSHVEVSVSLPRDFELLKALSNRAIDIFLKI